ncbi:hypothetical protein EDB19DRAFT_1835144 [Suillus lakei]|nr:hypothetical protein EDB19DRAFT_1835144 [Suillus lakei]
MRTCSSTCWLARIYAVFCTQSSIEDPDSAQAIEENNQTLASQVERIFVLKLALTLRGASNATSSHYDLPPEPEPESRDGGRGGFGTGDNGLGPLDASLPGENSSLGPSGSTGEDEQDSDRQGVANQVFMSPD